MPYINKKVYPLKSSAEGTLETTENALLKFADLQLATPYTISNFQGVYGNVKDSISVSISNAYVALKPSSGSIVYMVQTDSNGSFAINVPANTDYQLNVLADGFTTYTEDSINIVDSKYISREIALTADAELQSSKKAILGKVTSDGSAAIENAIVTLYDITTPNSPITLGLTATNAAGEYAFIGINPTATNLKVVAGSTAHNLAESAVTFGAGIFTIINLTATPIIATTSSLIQGTTTSDGSTISPNTVVILYEGTSPNGIAVAYTKANSLGYYSFVVPKADPAKTYYVKATNNETI
ncbi:carboxypeptidase-like regulatory domain-containing protein [Clostridium sp. B9]|uniref:carboxypeptidase-like regulatory domain-containing protein n=1 Tax=Clostridium sp. B9 TaxID=3423224 RepID=UPI003D2F2F96